MDKGWHHLPHPILIGGGGATSQDQRNALHPAIRSPVDAGDHFS
jgi:hypothetical protein